MIHTKFKLLLASALVLGATPFDAFAQGAAINVSRPALIITNEPIPEDIKNNIYSKPQKTRSISGADVLNSGYYEPANTMVGRKIGEITSDLASLQGKVTSLSSNLSTLQRENEGVSADYYAAIATVNTQLQSGTTPGNPRLVRRLSKAEENLERLNANVSELNMLAMAASDSASKVAFLLESSQSAFNISGAIEEDHKELAKLEDAIGNTMIIVERVLNGVNDDITRTNTYLTSERQNLRTLALAVSNGDLYGRSLANIHYSDAAPMAMVQNASYSPAPAAAQPASLNGPIPLMKIRFDRSDVQYEEPLYTAVNEALSRYPNAVFDLIAVSPTSGNAAEVAIETTRSRRNASKVLGTLTQLGLDPSRVNLSYEQNAEAMTNEVHLFIR